MWIEEVVHLNELTDPHDAFQRLYTHKITNKYNSKYFSL